MEKYVKVTLIALLLLAALATGGVFVVGANIDRYRPLVEKKLSAAIGRPVTAKRISLGWKGGLALAAKGVTVGDPSAPDASADSVDVLVDVRALFSKEIIVKRLFIMAPVFRFKKSASGVTLGDAPASAAPSENSPNEKQFFRIDLLKVEHGEVRWTDTVSAPPVEFVVRDVDVLIKNFDPGKGFDVEGSFAAFSEKTGVHFRAAVDLPGPASGTGGAVRRFEAEMDLGKLNLDELYRAAPELQNIGFREAPSGLASIVVTDAPFEGFPGRAQAKFILKEGKVFTRSLPAPLEHVAITAMLAGRDIKLENFSAVYAGGQIAAEGALSGFTAPDPAWAGRMSVRNLPADAVLPARPQGAPALTGEVSADFDGAARGTSWSRLSETLNGRGRLSLEKGAILNLNAARQVVDNLAKVPGIGDSIGSVLSPATRARLQEPHTALAPFVTDFEVRDGAFILPGAQIDTTDFTLVLAGAVGLREGGLNLQTHLFLSAELSATGARAVPEIASFLDANGRLEIPVRVSGTLRQPSFVADVKSIVTSIATSRGQQIITELLKKRQGGDSQAATTGTESSSYEGILKGLFQK